jgi:hypothetical protein
VTHVEIREASENNGIMATDVLVDELTSKGVRLVNEEQITISFQTNVLLNDLGLVELVSLALQLPVAPKIRRHLHQGVLQHRSYELGLKRLDYLECDNDWYYLSRSFNQLQQALRNLFDSGQVPFGREWRNKKDSLAYLKGLISQPEFEETVLPVIRKHYLNLREVELLMRWVRGTGKPSPAMTDIFQAGLNTDGPGIVRAVLLAKLPSTSDKALKHRRDVCFTCAQDSRCSPLQGVDDPSTVLAQYRYSQLDEIVTTKYPNVPLDQCFTGDNLLIKFFVPYSIVVSSKRFLIAIQCLENSSPILYKNRGKYCPKDDIWLLTQQTQDKGHHDFNTNSA